MVLFIGLLQIGDLHKQQHPKPFLFLRRRDGVGLKVMGLNLDGPAGVGLDPFQGFRGDLVQPAAEQPFQAGGRLKGPVDADNLLILGHHQSGDGQAEHRVLPPQLQPILRRAHQLAQIPAEQDEFIQGIAKGQHTRSQQKPEPQTAGKPGHHFQPDQRRKGNQIPGPKTPVFRSHASNFLQSACCTEKSICMATASGTPFSKGAPCRFSASLLA